MRNNRGPGEAGGPEERRWLLPAAGRGGRLALLLALAASLPSCFLHIGGGSDSDWNSHSESHWGSTSDSARRAREHNQTRLEGLVLGMSVDDAKKTMGTNRLWAGDSMGWIPNPYRSEAFRMRTGAAAMVLLYYTDLRARDDMIADDELTPLVFEEGALTGWGWPHYRRVQQDLDPTPLGNARDS